jgi:hypothetical protein
LYSHFSGHGSLICRPDTLLAQIEQNPWSDSSGDRIFWLLLSALIKSLAGKLDASNLGQSLVCESRCYQGIELLLGMYAFAIQIYFDFSGYSDLVIAMAMLLGYQLNQNFNLPYLAVNLRNLGGAGISHLRPDTGLRLYPDGG